MVDRPTRLADVADRYARYSHRFTRRQWLTVELYYRREMTQEQVAAELGCTRSAVSGLLTRARHIMNDIERSLRAEAFEASRKLNL